MIARTSFRAGEIGGTSGYETASDAIAAPTVALLAGSASAAGPNIKLYPDGNGWTFELVRRDRGVAMDDVIDANAPPASALTTTSNLSSASLSAFGPFLAGSATYTASTSIRLGKTTGMLSGNLTAEFDAPGPIKLTDPPLPAALTR